MLMIIGKLLGAYSYLELTVGEFRLIRQIYQLLSLTFPVIWYISL